MDLARRFCQMFEPELRAGTEGERGTGLALARSYLTELLKQVNKSSTPTARNFIIDDVIALFTETVSSDGRLRDLGLRVQATHDTAGAIDKVWRALTD